MKKLFVIFAVAFIAITMATSCQKDDIISENSSPVSVIQGDYFVQNGDIQLKSAPVGHTVTWTMLTNNANFYPGTPAASQYSPGLYLVDGRELITGTEAYNFWHNPANNPVSFPYGTAVYSNHTPDENVRVIAETKDATGNVIYIAMLDFNPNAASFPLKVNGYRFGDELYVDWSQIKALPGSANLKLKVTYKVSPKDVVGTKAKVYGGFSQSGIPSGSKELGWADLVYGTAGAPQTVEVPGTGTVEVLNTIDGKIIDDVVVELYEGDVLIGSQNVDAQGPGKGMKILITTDKVGWYHSSTIQWLNHDITINEVPIEFN